MTGDRGTGTGTAVTRAANDDIEGTGAAAGSEITIDGIGLGRGSDTGKEPGAAIITARDRVTAGGTAAVRRPGAGTRKDGEGDGSSF